MVRFCDLGPVRIDRAGVEVSPGGQKPTEILSLLLVNLNQRVSVDVLMDVLWSRPGAGSVSTLESHIYRLRKVLEPSRPRGAPSERLVNDAGGYRLLAATREVDSYQLSALAEETRALLANGDPDRALRRAVEAMGLWRGQPYAEVADAEWVAPAVARIQETYDQVCELHVQALLETGQEAQALAQLQALIPANLLRERLWAQAMLAQYRCHRPEEALATYQKARTTLRDELGLEPGLELRRLQEQILAQDPALEITRRPAAGPTIAHTTHLPRRTSQLIGRDHELATLRRLVGEDPLITITGAAGCGKTKLAIEVARASASGFPDGVWFIDLASVDNPDLVVDLVVSALGLQPPVVGTSMQSLRSYTRDRRMLLLLDNCEHVIEAVYDLAAELLGDDAAVHILATSREPVGLDTEVIWSLPPLEIPTPTQPDAPSLELFLTRLRAAAPTLSLSDQELESARTICVVLDGLPLALELAAGRIRSATLEEIADQAATDPGGLARSGAARRAAHQTLRDSIGWSFRLMDPDERLLHGRLSVLPGGFTQRAAAAVAGFAPLDPDRVRSLLDSLVHRSMLVASRSSRPHGATLYHQLASVRAHAARELQSSGSGAEAVASRHAWVRAMLAERPAIGRADTVGWYDELDDNFAAIRATLQHTLVDEPDPLAGYLLSRISNFWYYRARMVEAGRWLELAVPASDGTDPTDARMTELSLAGVYGMRGRFDLARPLVVKAVESFGGFPPDRLADVIEHFASLTLVAMLHQELDLVVVFRDAVLDASRRYPSDRFALVSASLSCLTALREVPIETSRQRAEDLYQQSIADGSLLAAWLACTVQTVVARVTEDSRAGLIWSDRINAIQLRLGARPEAFPLENRASLVAVTGPARLAVELYSASRILSRRVGLGWPLLPSTPERIDSLREALGVDAFDEAWRVGATRSAAEAWELSPSDVAGALPEAVD